MNRFQSHLVSECSSPVTVTPWTEEQFHTQAPVYENVQIHCVLIIQSMTTVYIKKEEKKVSDFLKIIFPLYNDTQEMTHVKNKPESSILAQTSGIDHLHQYIVSQVGPLAALQCY